MKIRGWGIPVLLSTLALVQCHVVSAESDDSDAYGEPSSVKTEDPALKAQLAKIHKGLEELDEQMAQLHAALQQETEDVKKATLSAKLDGLNKEREKLERIRREIVEEAKATEWTKIDQALKRAHRSEEDERYEQQQEALRDRQK